MWNRFTVSILLLLISGLGFSQTPIYDTSATRKTNLRIGASMKLALVPQRSLFFPEETINTDFYKEHFSLAPVPGDIDRGVASFQLGGNFAWILYSRNQKVELEFGLDLGYQNSGTVRDSIYSRITTSTNNYINAKTKVNYKLHELYSGGYFLIKSNNNFFDVFIGLGISHYFSVGRAEVTNYLLDNQINSYKTKFPFYSNFNPYIPVGFEVPLSKKYDFYMKLMGSIRREVNYDNFRSHRFFLTGGVQFQYQF